MEVNPLWQQKKLRELFKEKGIIVTVYSPLGAKGTLWGKNWVMDCEVLQEIANQKGKTVAQVLGKSLKKLIRELCVKYLEDVLIY